MVVIANAAKFHPFHAMAAIQAGKHVFVEKPHGIDPLGIKLLQQACDLAKEKKLCIVSGLQSRFHTGYIETMKRIHDGAIGDIVSIEENFLRPPYGVTERKPEYSELDWQCSTQYHFRWLSGDDVPQSLVHNLDRSSWVLGNAAPVKCHGLAGRSTMVEPLYGDVFDHHSVVYEFDKGVRVYAFCRTTDGCYDENSSLISGSQGQSVHPELPHLGRNQLALAGPMRPLPDRARQALRRHPLRQPHQLRRLHGAQHDDRRHGPDLLLHGQGGLVGADQRRPTSLPAQARGLPRRHGAADQAGRQRQLPRARAGPDQDDLNGNRLTTDGHR